MYSRLYTHILNHFPQIDHCASFHHIYTDSALFGLFASFIPASGRQANTSGHIFPHLVHQLSLLLYSNIPEQELSRAKNQLKSSLMMALESRAVEVEDLGRQVCLPFARFRGTTCLTRLLGLGSRAQNSRVGDVRKDRRCRQRDDPPRRRAPLRASQPSQGERRGHGSGGRWRLPGCLEQVRPG